MTSLLLRACALVLVCISMLSAPAIAQQATTETQATEAQTTQPAADPSLVSKQQIEELQATIENLRSQIAEMGREAGSSAKAWFDSDQPLSVTPEQLAGIAVGAAAGAVAVDALGGGGLASLTGAIVGGLAGHWIASAPPPAAPAEPKN